MSASVSDWLGKMFSLRFDRSSSRKSRLDAGRRANGRGAWLRRWPSARTAPPAPAEAAPDAHGSPVAVVVISALVLGAGLPIHCPPSHSVRIRWVICLWDPLHCPRFESILMSARGLNGIGETRNLAANPKLKGTDVTVNGTQQDPVTDVASINEGDSFFHDLSPKCQGWLCPANSHQLSVCDAVATGESMGTSIGARQRPSIHSPSTDTHLKDLSESFYNLNPIIILIMIPYLLFRSNLNNIDANVISIFLHFDIIFISYDRKIGTNKNIKKNLNYHRNEISENSKNMITFYWNGHQTTKIYFCKNNNHFKTNISDKER